MNPIQQLRAFLKRSHDRRDRAIGGYPELTRHNLRAVVIMAEEFAREHPHRAQIIIASLRPALDNAEFTD